MVVAYRWLADLVMLVHFGFVAYVALGGFLAWWRRWLIVPHALAALWGALIVAIESLECPLTGWERWARERAGQDSLPRGFIDTYLTGVVYPERYLLAVQLLVAVLVVVSWAGMLRTRSTISGSARQSAREAA